jgi:hypothetical protein
MLDGVFFRTAGRSRKWTGAPAGWQRARRPAGLSHLQTVPISVTNRRVDVETPFTTKAGRTHKTHRQGPVFPASASATTITSDHHDGRRRSLRQHHPVLRFIHFSSAAGLLTSHG